MKSLNQLKVLIVGLGQIGGSLGMDLVKKRLVAEVVGFDIDKTLAKKAKRLRAVDSMANSLSEGIGKADLIILAIPIREIKKLIPFVGQYIKKETVVLDVGSTKVEILRRVSELDQRINFIGGHPLAGSEKCGLKAAQAGKFANTTFVLIPFPETKSEWVSTVKKLVRSLGAKPLFMTAEEHDRLIALTSSLPYLFSIALMHQAAKYEEKYKKIWDLVGGSFISATRVARSSPGLTLDMFLANRKNVGNVIEQMMVELANLKQMIEKGEEKTLKNLIKQVKKKREMIQSG
ncbi:MAG: prephenate dehydrogenase [Candidatus Zixiibacteriota bacterium]